MYASNRPTLGRRMLMTDEREITKDNIISVVSKAFMEHQENVAQEVFLFEYEKGNQPILNREKKIRPDLNATVVENNASKIVDVHLGYCFSNPITFVQRAKIEPTKKQKKALFGFLRKKDEDDGENIDDLKIAMLNKMMQEQSKAAKDIALGRNLFICGVGYQMMLPNRNKNRYSPFELLVPSPLTTFVVYSNDAYREPVLGCTYSVHDDGTITLTAYSKNFCYTIEHELNTTDYHLKENIAPNPLRRIPVVEFYLNDRMGIFEKVIPLMDAMNLVDSDRINDILQHVQSLLWMHNCQVNEEGKKNLVDGDGVIMTKSTLTAPAKSSYNQSGHYYGVQIIAKDEAGNTTTVNQSDATLGSKLRLTVKEKTAPVITISSPTASQLLTSNQPTISFTVTDDDSGVNPDTIKLLIDGSEISGITKTKTTSGYSCSYKPSTALSDGSHTVVVKASDYDGNAATQKSVSFKIDTVPPELSVTSPVNKLVTNKTTVTVAGTTNDATSSPVTLTINGSAVTVYDDGTFSKDITLKDGSNTITVVAKDGAGRTTTVTRTVTLDTKAPVISDVSLAPNPADVGATYVISVSVTD